MIEKTAEGKLGSWLSPESNLTIEYPLELLDEIRLTVSSSFQMRARGGLEIGGVLFGSRSENAIRIAAWRPVACDHSQGGSFILSDKDMQELARLLEISGVDPDLRGSTLPAGLYRIRAAVLLSRKAMSECSISSSRSRGSLRSCCSRGEWNR